VRVLVTGGAGYIGSHAVRALSRAGHQPLVLDNLVYGHARIVREVLGVPLVVGQVGDTALVRALLQGTHPELRGTPHEGRPIEAVLHFAAYAYVGESVSDPARYYRNNLGDTLTLLEALVDPVRGLQTKAGASSQDGSSEPPIPIVFSSTCATYGVPQQVPITEEHPQQPINPYGRSKWMVEQLLHDFARAYGLPSVIFRYFNAAGADPAIVLKRVEHDLPGEGDVLVDAAGLAALVAMEQTGQLTATQAKTVLGEIKLDSKGDLTDPVYVWYTFKDGQYFEDPSVK
jgi:UDP-glucose 4-epimerase